MPIIPSRAVNAPGDLPRRDDPRVIVAISMKSSLFERLNAVSDHYGRSRLVAEAVKAYLDAREDA